MRFTDATRYDTKDMTGVSFLFYCDDEIGLFCLYFLPAFDCTALRRRYGMMATIPSDTPQEFCKLPYFNTGKRLLP